MFCLCPALFMSAEWAWSTVGAPAMFSPAVR